ncbi:hypothetical protein BRW62_03670 [Parathermosynechococcus lividus PCC 6715]|uniref:Transposase IS204/IS1001/IS1096/IS1165 zinc-finger domain-containing protein n=1 Tax=Parathermosynechococcus lividus PCC 6715 TaxID=1917166 RepID=A0A2D2Q0F6_PARLV|nr:hypothetical protein [Thermostichus lividus]ATS17990.1 hypothetical protein BRW62_03670 [Thermostichus lividus PCC 6715]
MQLLLTELLNLPGIEVEDYTDVAGELILIVEAKTIEAICPRCQQKKGAKTSESGAVNAA